MFYAIFYEKYVGYCLNAYLLGQVTPPTPLTANFDERKWSLTYISLQYSSAGEGKCCVLRLLHLSKFGYGLMLVKSMRYLLSGLIRLGLIAFAHLRFKIYNQLNSLLFLRDYMRYKMYSYPPPT